MGFKPYELDKNVLKPGDKYFDKKNMDLYLLRDGQSKTIGDTKVKIDFLSDANVLNEEITFVVIVSRHNNQWVVVRHRQRSTWEVPGGHREDQEDSQKAAERELYEETGAKEFKVFPVCVYSVKNDDKITYGKLFYADIKEFGDLPNFEIAEIKLVDDILKEALTYPGIQPVLIQKVKEYLRTTRSVHCGHDLLKFKKI